MPICYVALVFLYLSPCTDVIDRLATPKTEDTPPAISFERCAGEGVPSIDFWIVDQFCIYHRLPDDRERYRGF